MSLNLSAFSIALAFGLGAAGVFCTIPGSTSGTADAEEGGTNWRRVDRDMNQ